MKYLLVLLLLPGLARACSLCANVRQSPTIRQEAARPSAPVILHGTLENPRLHGDTAGNGAGTTDFRVIEVLKVDERLPAGYRKKAGDVLVLPSYFPIEDVKTPPHYLAFCSATREG